MLVLEYLVVVELTLFEESGFAMLVLTVDHTFLVLFAFFDRVFGSELCILGPHELKFVTELSHLTSK